jgi:hypothetical protein
MFKNEDRRRYTHPCGCNYLYLWTPESHWVRQDDISARKCIKHSE